MERASAHACRSFVVARALPILGGLALAAVPACGASPTLPQMPWDHPSIVELAAKEPGFVLSAPTVAMKGAKGVASASYASDYGASLQPDGRIVFPQGTSGKIKGNTILAGSSVVATLSADGEVSGKGLKHKYRFTLDGDLLDADGRGVRLSPEGGVRAIGGRWHYQDVMQWSPDQGGAWDHTGWRTMAVVSLIVIENLLPDALNAPQ